MSLFIISIFTPYITVVFYHHDAGFFLSILLFLLSLIILIISTLSLCSHEVIIARRKYYGWIATTAVILFFVSYGSQLELAERFFLKKREQKLAILISQIQTYGRIRDMNDGLSYWSTLNGTAVAEDSSVVAKSSGPNKRYFLADILRRDKIDKTHYDSVKSALIQLNFISLTTLSDGTISFTIGGFIDNCSGIAYSVTGAQPASNDCGDIVRWVKIGENWYAWGTT